MKRHADIGANLLSSIRFPYPVVPIVRHHHENWDGSGYPSQISGTDIPLGARVLSVVDCFDALTSDRPYRPRLSTEEAFEILRQRRGTMYDPLVVDTFVTAYTEIAPAAIKAGIDARSLTAAWSAKDSTGQEDSPYAQIRVNAAESALLMECAQTLMTVTSPAAALLVASQCLRQLTPATVYALYRHDDARDQLNCEQSIGDPYGLLNGLTIRVGERITGWCAANHRTSLNSHASLDLAQISEQFVPPLRRNHQHTSNRRATVDRYTDGVFFQREPICGVPSIRIRTCGVAGRAAVLYFDREADRLVVPKKSTLLIGESLAKPRRDAKGLR